MLNHKSATHVILDFPDPAAFRNLCGIHHHNLAQIEQVFSVTIQAPGGHMVIDGAEDMVSKACTVVQRLYTRALGGETIADGEIRAAFSFVTTGTRYVKQDQISFGDGRKQIVARNPAQQNYMRSLKDSSFDLVFGSGPAGTGKTFLAIAYGVSLLLSKRVKQMVVARPALEAGERLGFLPGDLEEKVDPYMMPIWDAFQQTLGAEKLSRLREQGQIQIAPLAFMRGRTFSDAYIVLDEAQNATIGQMQMVLTRLGEGGHMVVTGDPDQSDLPANIQSGLSHAIGILENVEGVSCNRFTADDVVRHPLVARIIRAYDADKKAGRND